MGARIVVDASVWVSQLMPWELNHNTSLFWLNRFITTGGLLVAPTILLAEVAASISRRTGQIALAKEALRKLRSTDAMDFVPLDGMLMDVTVDVATNLRLRAGDATYVALAHQLNIPLVTWDREQLQRGASLITTYTPDSYTFQSVQQQPLS